MGLTEAAPSHDVASKTDPPPFNGGFQDVDGTRSVLGSFHRPSAEEAIGVLYDLGKGIGGAFATVRDQ